MQLCWAATLGGKIQQYYCKRPLLEVPTPGRCLLRTGQPSTPSSLPPAINCATVVASQALPCGSGVGVRQNESQGPRLVSATAGGKGLRIARAGRGFARSHAVPADRRRRVFRPV